MIFPSVSYKPNRYSTWFIGSVHQIDLMQAFYQQHYLAKVINTNNTLIFVKIMSGIMPLVCKSLMHMCVFYDVASCPGHVLNKNQ